MRGCLRLTTGALQNRTPLHAALTINPIDRLFVRAGLQTTTEHLRRPGYFLELGGRL